MHLPGASFGSQQLIHSNDRDPECNEPNHTPAKNQAPDWVLDRTIGGGLKVYERPEQDYLGTKTYGENSTQSSVVALLNVFGSCLHNIISIFWNVEAVFFIAISSFCNSLLFKTPDGYLD